MNLKHYIVSGYALVPVKIEVPVDDVSEARAIESAKRRFKNEPSKFIVPNSYDDSSVHDWRWNEVRLLETQPNK